MKDHRQEETGEGWVLNGDKWFVTGGERAGFFIVLAWAGEEQASFLVERETPGLEFVRTPVFMHDPYASKHVELRLKDCRVPEGARLGTRRIRRNQALVARWRG